MPPWRQPPPDRDAGQHNEDIDLVRRELDQVIELNTSVRPAEAEERFRNVIMQCSESMLHTLDLDLRHALDTFLPKRRRTLAGLLAVRRTAGPRPSEHGPQIRQTQPDRPAAQPIDAEAHAASESPRVPSRDETPGSPAPDLAQDLREISELNRTVRPADAEARLRALVETLSGPEIIAAEAVLQEALAEFLPKRRRALDDLLKSALAAAEDRQVASPVVLPATAGGTAPPRTQSPPNGRPSAESRSTGMPLAYMNDRFTNALGDLSKLHIFQWTTYYRDVLSEYFDAFLEDLGATDGHKRLLDLVRSALSHHAREIYRKGYLHVTATQGLSDRYALTKSLTGLQRFLDLPLEFYSARLADAHHNETATLLRRVCSAMEFGILHGYASAQFDLPGSGILPRFPRSWAHVLPFLTSEDLQELTTVLEPGVFLEGVKDSVMPLVEVLDIFMDRDPTTAPLPALSQYVEASRRLDVSLQLSPRASDARLVEVQSYLSAEFVDRHYIEEAAGRAVSAVLAPLRSDLRGLVASVARLDNIVVPTGGSAGEVGASTRLRSVLEPIVYATTIGSAMDRPISFNYARAFPLENPFLTKYNHVYRSSVRRLMQSFERRNGVRLWCSVRRSGKTTACAADLGSTTARSVVVAQTCESTRQMPDGDIFYRRVTDALESGRRLKTDFVEQAVAECLLGAGVSEGRAVLVLDEYETLFGDLVSALSSRPELRYLVVQPLLNQLVAFTQENLLVFVGQQPNAHFILLDQNQLSPVVEQDAFPLFTHDPRTPTTGEFHELLRKVMTSHVDLEPEFVTVVHSETGGHPFLTVKLLVAFMDWLMCSGRPVSCLNPVRAELFDEFARHNLTYSAIAFSPHYEFFKATAAGHLSADGRTSSPWLHSVYAILRSLSLESPTTLSCTVDDYVSLARRAMSSDMSPELLLGTAAAANFLSLEGSLVRPRIPLLARIAAAVKPR